MEIVVVVTWIILVVIGRLLLLSQVVLVVMHNCSLLSQTHDHGCHTHILVFTHIIMTFIITHVTDDTLVTLSVYCRLFTVTGCDVSATQRHQLVKLVSLYTQANITDNDIILDDTDRVLEALYRQGKYRTLTECWKLCTDKLSTGH